MEVDAGLSGSVFTLTQVSGPAAVCFFSYTIPAPYPIRIFEDGIDVTAGNTVGYLASFGSMARPLFEVQVTTSGAASFSGNGSWYDLTQVGPAPAESDTPCCVVNEADNAAADGSEAWNRLVGGGYILLPC
jgi:hypothetical protein